MEDRWEKLWDTVDPDSVSTTFSSGQKNTQYVQKHTDIWKEHFQNCGHSSAAIDILCIGAENVLKLVPGTEIKLPVSGEKSKNRLNKSIQCTTRSPYCNRDFKSCVWSIQRTHLLPELDFSHSLYISNTVALAKMWRTVPNLEAWLGSGKRPYFGVK